MAIDPICGMTVDATSALSAKHDGQTFYFCSDHCRQKFLSPPANAEPEKEPPGKTIYTCPMPPEIEQDQPGNCPKCGMALEPVTSGGEEKNKEFIDMSRRFWVCTAFALPVFFLAMIADMLPDWLPNWFSMHMVQWIECTLATPVVVWGGWPFFVRGWQSVRTWNLNMFTLIALGGLGRLGLQHDGTLVTWALPTHHADAWRAGGGLFRSRGNDYHAGSAGAGA